MKMYLKIFFGMGIYFGLVMGIYGGVSSGMVIGIRVGVFFGLFFGLFTSLILGITHKIITRKIANGSLISPRQSKIVELDSRLDLEFDKSLMALNQYCAKIISQDKTKFEIKAKTGITWRSWGEIIMVRLSMANQKVKIEISSSPKIEWTLIDQGRGRENVEKIAKLLTSGNN